MNAPFRPDAAAQAAVREALGRVPVRTELPEHSSQKKRDRPGGETTAPAAVPTPVPPSAPSLPVAAAAESPAVQEEGRTAPPDGEAATAVDVSPELFKSRHRRPKYPA